MIKIKNNSNYVGLKFINGIIELYLPYGYPNISQDDANFQADFMNLLRTVSIAKNVELELNYGMYDNDVPLYSYFWIISNYINNGLYKEISKYHSNHGKGKINWNKTLKTRYYFQKNEPVFLNLILDQKRPETNIITEIEKYCINKAFEYIGPVFGKVQKLNTSINEKNKSNCYRILYKELKNTFEEKKQILLRHMINIINDEIGENNIGTVRSYGTYEYHYSWEKMIDKLYDNTEDSFLPASKYIIYNKGIENASKLIPDTVIETDNSILIIDSKYYAYCVDPQRNPLPSTSSINKQITYSEFAKKKKRTKTVYNAFILPYNGDELSIIGEAIPNWKNGEILEELKTYERILVILADTQSVISDYCNDKKRDKEALIDTIEKTLYKHRKNKII